MVFIRNVKFSVAECNSFNMRKKNVGYLASKHIIGGSHAKKQSSKCKEAIIKMQRSNHQDAKKQSSKCKEAIIKMQRSNHQNAKKQSSRCKKATIKMQSCNFRSVKLQPSKCNSKFFRFQFEISSIHQWRIFDWKYLRLPSDSVTLFTQ